jgi:hypothetical protein
MQRVPAGLTPILPDGPEKANTFRDHGYCHCFVCGESYLVEPDAYGDGCMLYYLGIMQEKLEGGKDI